MEGKNELSTEERLENGIKHQPDRYIFCRDGKGSLVQVDDCDSGGSYYCFYKNGVKHWIWVE